MKLMINHQTHYQYTEMASKSVQYIKMSPQTNIHQKVHSWDISVPGQKNVSKDVFDNVWITSTQNYNYQNLIIMAQGVVEIDTQNKFAINTSLSPIQFLQPTPSTLCDEQMFVFAQQYISEVSKKNVMRLAEALLIEMPYTTASTSVKHTASESFLMKLGVCQDHSHVLIAMCKALGIPARYASGYLFVQNSAHLASHAWAEVFIDQQWHCIDVSNQLFQPSSHIYVAIGRDYWDVAPVRGVRAKGGTESMYSIVQVLAC